MGEDEFPKPISISFEKLKKRERLTILRSSGACSTSALVVVGVDTEFDILGAIVVGFSCD